MKIKKYSMKTNLISRSILILLIFVEKIPLKNAQQTNTTLQTDGKGLKAIAELKNDTVEVKIDIIKKEMRDYMRECGVDVPEIEEDPKANVETTKAIDKTTNTNKLGNLNMAPTFADNLNDGRKKKKKGTYPTSYGNSDKKNKNKKRRGNNDCDDDIDDSCEDEDDDKDDDDSDEDEDDRRRGKGKKKGKGGRGERNRRDMSTLVEQFNTTEAGQAADREDTEMNEDFKKKNKNRGGNKRGGNRDYDDDEEEDDDNDGGKRCGAGGGKGKKNKGGRGGGKGKNRGGQGGGGKKNKGGRGGNKGGGGKKHGDDFGGGEGGSHGGSPFDTGVGGMGPGMGDNYGYPGISASGYFHGNPYGYGGYSGYIRQLGDSELISRIKRQEDKIDCVSQCVFGYMEILDDNRVPSETALISYYQEKITNNDKKSETIRNVRRCFARLIATDTEDGCKFSKSVAACLNLELDP